MQILLFIYFLTNRNLFSLKDLLNERDVPVPDIINVSAKFLLERLDHRYPITENMIVATFLDPSMQNLSLIGEYCKNNDTDMTQLLVKKWFEYDPKLTVKVVAQPTKPRSAVSKLRLELIGKHVETSNGSVNSIETNIQREYLKYTAISDIVDDPLLWWKTHEKTFPYLSALSKVMLAIPASSGATETHFSESGFLITKKKATIDPLTVTKVMFIHDNFDHLSNCLN